MGGVGGDRRTMADYGIVEEWRKSGPKEKDKGGRMMTGLETF